MNIIHTLFQMKPFQTGNYLSYLTAILLSEPERGGDQP